MLAGFLKEFLALPQEKQDELLLHFRHVMGDDASIKILSHLTDIQDDPEVEDQTRLNTLERIGRYSASAKRTNRKKKDQDGNRVYIPIIQKYDVVWVNFSGLGSEFDLPHLAIVWDVEQMRDHVVVLPTTSFKESSTVESGVRFNIGKIGFLSEESVVLLNQTTVVSRKRILDHMHEVPGTRRKDTVQISTSQKHRIQEGFRVLWFEERTLLDEIMNFHRDRLPVMELPDVQYEHLHRPVLKIEASRDKFVYALYDNPAVSYTILRRPCSTKGKVRKRLLEAWVQAKATETESRYERRCIAYEAVLENVRDERPVGVKSKKEA